jgi:hypothetical protein
MRLRAGALLTVALVGALLGGCAQDGDENGNQRTPGPPLTAKQMKSVLLVKGNLGNRFAIDRTPSDSGDSHDPNLGCLNPLRKLERKMPEALREREIDFVAKTRVGSPGVNSFVATYRSVTLAERSLDLFDRTVEDCHRVSTRNGGARVRLSVGTTTLTLAKGAEQQVNLSASGSFNGPAGGIPFTLEWTVVRLGRHVVGVVMIDYAKSLQGARRDLTDAAMERLIAVIDGKKPPEPKPVLADYPLVKELRPSL